jgi:hypothetical protein
MESPESPMRAALISHLSKEIEILSTNMVTTRLKATFTFWVGPFLLLGALVIRPQPISIPIRFDLPLGWSLLLLGLIYLVSAYIGGRLEHYAATKCNEWRDLIAQASLESTLALNDVRRLLLDSYLPQRVRLAYLAVFALTFSSFGIILFVLIHLSGAASAK